MENQQKQRIIFSEKADMVLEDIIKKYNLGENDDEIIKRLSEHKPSSIVIIDEITKNFVQQNLSEKDLITALQKDLGVSQQTAKKMSEDIKNNLVPLLEKVPEIEFEKPTIGMKTMPAIPIREDLTISEANLPPYQKKPLEIPSEEIIRKNIENFKNTEQVPETEKPVVKKPFEKEKPKPSQKSSDTYREPIE